MAWITTHPSLLERLRDGSDDAAWAEFDRCYGELIMRYCRSRGLKLSDAEDVRQLALMQFARAARNFEYSPARGRFRGYLGQVVRSAISRHAARPNGRERALDEGVLSSIPDPGLGDELWEREWVEHHLRRAMATLRRSYSPRSVEVFDRILAGESVPAIAERMKMTEQAVHKIKQRIRDRLKTLVADQVREEEEAGDE